MRKSFVPKNMFTVSEGYGINIRHLFSFISTYAVLTYKEPGKEIVYLKEQLATGLDIQPYMTIINLYVQHYKEGLDKYDNDIIFAMDYADNMIVDILEKTVELLGTGKTQTMFDKNDYIYKKLITYVMTEYVFLKFPTISKYNQKTTLSTTLELLNINIEHLWPFLFDYVLTGLDNDTDKKVIYEEAIASGLDIAPYKTIIQLYVHGFELDVRKHNNFLQACKAAEDYVIREFNKSVALLLNPYDEESEWDRNNMLSANDLFYNKIVYYVDHIMDMWSKPIPYWTIVDI